MCALPFICDVILAFSLITQVAFSHLANIYIYIYILLHPSTHWIFFEWSLVDLQFFDPFVDFYFILFFFTLDFPQGIHNYLAIKLKSLVGVCWGNICVGGMSMKDTRSLMELIDNLSMWVPQQAPNLRDN